MDGSDEDLGGLVGTSTDTRQHGTRIPNSGNVPVDPAAQDPQQKQYRSWVEGGKFSLLSESWIQ